MVVRKSIALTVLALLVTGPAAAHGPEARFVYARVVAAEPIVRRVTVERPRQVCREEIEYRSAPGAATVGPTIAGGLVGAAIGHELGDRHNRDALAFIGALAGSTAGHAWALRHSPPSEQVAVPVERCHVVAERRVEEVIEGYRVTYQYHGRRYSTRMPRHPGDRIRVDARLRPVGYR